jgi:hypothetical protein
MGCHFYLLGHMETGTRNNHLNDLNDYRPVKCYSENIVSLDDDRSSIGFQCGLTRSPPNHPEPRLTSHPNPERPTYKCDAQSGSPPLSSTTLIFHAPPWPVRSIPNSQGPRRLPSEQPPSSPVTFPSFECSPSKYNHAVHYFPRGGVAVGPLVLRASRRNFACS